MLSKPIIVLSIPMEGSYKLFIPLSTTTLMNGVISRLRGPGLIPSTNTSEPLTRKLGDKLLTVAVMGSSSYARAEHGAPVLE